MAEYDEGAGHAAMQNQIAAHTSQPQEVVGMKRQRSEDDHSDGRQQNGRGSATPMSNLPAKPEDVRFCPPSHVLIRRTLYATPPWIMDISGFMPHICACNVAPLYFPFALSPASCLPFCCMLLTSVISLSGAMPIPLLIMSMSMLRYRIMVQCEWAMGCQTEGSRFQGPLLVHRSISSELTLFMSETYNG